MNLKGYIIKCGWLNEKYEKWLLQKRPAFNKMIVQLEEENRRRTAKMQRREKKIRERQHFLGNIQNRAHATWASDTQNPVENITAIHETPNDVHGQCREEILSLIQQ